MSVAEGATPRVLVVEDDGDLRNLLRLVLSGQGFQVAVAADGRDALDHLGESLPDIVVTDLMMPKVDGFALCSELRQREPYDHVPILVLTAVADSPQALQLAAMPGIRVMQKPARMKELGGLLREMIDDLRHAGGDGH